MRDEEIVDDSSAMDPYDTTVVRFPRIASAIEESIVWDGVYFVRIAECGGYEYEHSMSLQSKDGSAWYGYLAPEREMLVSRVRRCTWTTMDTGVKG
ncbi:hypothetical protein LguiA_007666 [Lonicera macranthoides]